jgi:hypothetical protein
MPLSDESAALGLFHTYLPRYLVAISSDAPHLHARSPYLLQIHYLFLPVVGKVFQIRSWTVENLWCICFSSFKLSWHWNPPVARKYSTR